MKHRRSPIVVAALGIACTVGLAGPVSAQVAGGTTTVDTRIVESTTLAMGWSVKKTLMGKTLYDERGQKVGEIEDLIIAPDRNVSYVIVGAGGFVGIGRHDVAIPVTQVQDKAGKLVIAGATKETIKAMPEFAYAPDTTTRDAFVAAADKDIAQGKAAMAGLEKKAGAATADAKSRIDGDIAALRADVNSAEGKLTEMKQAGVARWKEFEADVSAATGRLRKSTQKALG